MSDNPIALVTGAAQGIGYACAQALSDDGYRLVLCDIQGDNVIAAAKKLGNDSVGTVSYTHLTLPTILLV